MTIRFTHPASRPWLAHVADPTPPAGGTAPTPGQAPAPVSGKTTEPPAAPAAGGDEEGPADAGAPGEDAGTKPNDKRVLADLARERKKRQALEQQMAGFTEALKRLAGEPEDGSDVSELDRLTSRMAALEAQAEESKVAALRMQIVAETGVRADLAEFLTGTDEQTLRQQAQKLVAATATPGGPQRPAPDPAQGAKPSADQLTEIDTRIAEALKAGDVKTSIALKRHRAALASTR